MIRTAGFDCRRVGLGEVVIPEHEDVGVLDVLVAADCAVQAEAALQAGQGAGPGKADTGLDVVGSQRALEQLPRHVGIGKGPLRRSVEGNAVLAVLLAGLAKPARHHVQRLAQGYLDQAPITPDHGPCDSITSVERLHRVIALDTGRSPAHRRVGIALHGDRPSILHPDEQPATDAAEATWGLLPDWRNAVGAGASPLHGKHDAGDHGGCGAGRRYDGRPLQKRPSVNRPHRLLPRRERGECAHRGAVGETAGPQAVRRRPGIETLQRRRGGRRPPPGGTGRGGLVSKLRCAVAAGLPPLQRPGQGPREANDSRPGAGG
jgi:hypothetical protein